MRDYIKLMEGAIMEGALQSINNAMTLPGIGEYIQYGFQDAQSPEELKAEMQQLVRSVHRAYSTGDEQAKQDYGIGHNTQSLQILNSFVRGVMTSPQEYFDAYQQSKSAPIGGAGV